MKSIIRLLPYLGIFLIFLIIVEVFDLVSPSLIVNSVISINFDDNFYAFYSCVSLINSFILFITLLIFVSIFSPLKCQKLNKLRVGLISIINKKWSITLLSIYISSLLLLKSYTYLDIQELTDFVSTLALLASAITALFVFLKSYIQKTIASTIVDAKSEFNLIIGLSRTSKYLLENLENTGSYVLIDSTQEDYSSYIEKGVGVFDGDPSVALKEKMNRAKSLNKVIVSTGKDLLNIELALTLINVFVSKELSRDKCKTIRLIVEIENREFKEIFYQSVKNLIGINNDKFEIETFSFYEACTEQLFREYKLGGQHDLPKTYNIVICGKGFLVEQLTYQLGKLMHFIGRNKLALNLIHPDANKIKKKLV